MQSKLILSTAAGLMVLVSVPVNADTGQGYGIFTSQVRSVSGSAFASDGINPASDSDAEDAMDFGPFNAGAAASAEIADVALGTGGGTLDSTLMLNGLNAAGSAFATAEGFDSKGTADGSGFSRCVMEFEIPTKSQFTLQGSIAAFDSGLTFVSLRDSANEIYGATVVGPATRLAVNEFGTLQPGAYTLEIESSGNAFADPFTSEFAFAEYSLNLDIESGAAVPSIDDWGLVAMAGLMLCAATLIWNYPAGVERDASSHATT